MCRFCKSVYHFMIDVSYRMMDLLIWVRLNSKFSPFALPFSFLQHKPTFSFIIQYLKNKQKIETIDLSLSVKNPETLLLRTLLFPMLNESQIKARVGNRRRSFIHKKCYGICIVMLCVLFMQSTPLPPHTHCLTIFCHRIFLISNVLVCNKHHILILKIVEQSKDSDCYWKFKIHFTWFSVWKAIAKSTLTILIWMYDSWKWMKKTLQMPYVK